MINRCSISMILSKYCIPSVNMKVREIKSLMWKSSRLVINLVFYFITLLFVVVHV